MLINCLILQFKSLFLIGSCVDRKKENTREDFVSVFKCLHLRRKIWNFLLEYPVFVKSMRKLAGRTLLEALPPKLLVYLESKLGSLANVPGTTLLN